MADKSRSIQTKFWYDTWVEELNTTEKLLYLYLLTNPLTNLLGIYEISLKRMSNESGIPQATIRKGLELFEKDSRVIYTESFVIIPKFLKNQNLNPNMKLGAEHIFDALPKSIKDKILDNGSKGFESIRNGLLKLKGKGKGKKEIESEVKINIPFISFWNLYDKKVGQAVSNKLWGCLTNKERTSIIDYIPKYKKAQPDKAFRKDPERFMTKRVWKDEIVIPKPKDSRGTRRQGVVLTEEQKEQYR